MEKKIQVVPSGISLVDKSWGGFYRGGTYFLIGQHKSGKTLLGIQYLMECVKQREVCLFFTTMRPKDLMFHAASINFDFQKYMDQNLIIVIRVSSPPASQTSGDENLVEYLSDIAALVKQYNPSRIVFDELTPFIEFQNLNILKDAFLQTIEIIEESNICSLFILGEPATSHSKSIVDVLTAESTGSIILEKAENELKIKSGIMTIIPNVGHIEGKYSANYYLIPYKGISTENIQVDKKIETIKQPLEAAYKRLSEIELPDIYSGLNFYTIDELGLYINNQIAFYKSTKQKFLVMSFFLEKEAEKSGLLNMNQLKNVIRLSIDRKDKISVLNDKIIVLVLKDENENINILARIKSNLPVNTPDDLKKISDNILINFITVDETVNTSDDIFKRLWVEEAGIVRYTRFL